jgi:hypothetical protein
MARSRQALSRRGRRPSLRVAARRANKLQKDVKSLLADLEDLENRLVRLETLLEASRKAEKEKARRKKTTRTQGIRGKGPNVRDIAYQILLRRRKPLGIQEISRQVLKAKKGKAGDNFTQNLGAALARDKRFERVGRGVYAAKR